MKRALLLSSLLGVAALAVLHIPVGGSVSEKSPMKLQPVQCPDLSRFSDAPLTTKLNLLFIHHSCGGQLLAPVGPSVGTNAIHTSHPNGGNLRALLNQSGYSVHEASYGSRIGEATDVFDWLPKFRTQMEDILKCSQQDERHSGTKQNQVVMFKSCYPNNAFRSLGMSPGNPAGPDLTVANAKASYTALLEEFRQRPDVLFVCVTAPPLAPQQQPVPLWRQLARKLKGTYWSLQESGPLARQFNSWLAGADGWLNDYPLQNVVVFDYYHVLTGNGTSDFSAYPTGDGYDSHPSSEGNQLAAHKFVPFLNRAVRRANLVP